MIRHLARRLAARFPYIRAAIDAWRRLPEQRQFRAYANPPVRGAAVETPYGFRLHIGAGAVNREMASGKFEVEEMEVFRGQLARADVFIDVGANIGLYACAARSLGKRVVAVEPQPANLRVLYANLLANRFTDVEVMPLGVSDRPGVATLYGASGTGASLLRGWASQDETYATVIAITTLDIITSNRFAGQKVIIKIDIEGAEYLALRGAADLLKMSPAPTWMIEICLNEYHPSGSNPYYADTFELFWAAGYVAHTADRNGKTVTRENVEKWVKQGQCDSGSINYLWTRN